MRHRRRGAAAFIIIAFCACALAASDPAAATPQNPSETLFIEAQKALARGDYDGAETLLAESLERDPSFVSAIWQLAQIRESRGDLERARALLSRGLAIDPGASWARERLAGIDARLGAIENRRRRDERPAAPERRPEPPPDPAAPSPDAVAAAGHAPEETIESSQAAPPAAAATLAAAAPPAAAALLPPPQAARDESAAGGLLPLVLVSVASALAAGVLLIRFRKRPAPPIHPLEGSIGLVPALDVVALLSANRRTGLLVFDGDGASGEIHFDAGAVVHAVCGALSGKQAFHRLVGARSGRFVFHNRPSFARRTIAEPLSTLLLSSMKPDADGGPSAGARPGARETAAARR